jgi:hypothetical protein
MIGRQVIEREQPQADGDRDTHDQAASDGDGDSLPQWFSLHLRTPLRFKLARL